MTPTVVVNRVELGVESLGEGSWPLVLLAGRRSRFDHLGKDHIELGFIRVHDARDVRTDEFAARRGS